MTKKIGHSCCSEAEEGISCCRVESLIAVDERGQMVLPKDLRAKAGIKAGDKLAVVSWKKNGGVSCITLVKVEKLTGLMTEFLGPIVKNIVKDLGN